MARIIVTAVLEVHERHSQGWLKDLVREAFAEPFGTPQLLIVEYIPETKDETTKH